MDNEPLSNSTLKKALLTNPTHNFFWSTNGAISIMTDNCDVYYPTIISAEPPIKPDSLFLNNDVDVLKYIIDKLKPRISTLEAA